ncbi:MAG: type II secretion system F family protein [Jatrophihabitantaceae bacterium]
MSAAAWMALALLLLPARAARIPARHRDSGAGRAPPASLSAGWASAPEAGGLPSEVKRFATLPTVAAAATAVLAVLLGGWPGVAVALPLAAAAGWLVARWSRAKAVGTPPETRSVAFVVDLLAGALAAGSPPELAIERVTAAVAEHGNPSLRHAVEPLSRVGRLLQLGSEPATAWAVLRQVPGYGPVADSGRRCATSGARLAQALAAAATELRAEHQAQALTRAERVGVWSLLPLGLCFLPAFVCLGVLPVVLGVAGEVFSGVTG